jgi:hypothetical protein
VKIRNKLIFYDEELLARRPTPKLEDHPLSALRDCIFTIFAATLHIWRPSPPSATWGHAMPWWQGTHLTWPLLIQKYFYCFQIREPSLLMNICIEQLYQLCISVLKYRCYEGSRKCKVSDIIWLGTSWFTQTNHYCYDSEIDEITIAIPVAWWPETWNACIIFAGNLRSENLEDRKGEWNIIVNLT